RSAPTSCPEMNARGSPANARACASRMASRYVMLIRSSSRPFLARFEQSLRRHRPPVFPVRIGHRLALNGGDGILSLLNHLAPPKLDGPRVSPALLQQMFLGHFQAVAADGRLRQFGVEV